MQQLNHDEENITLVNLKDEEVGFATKEAVHEKGLLHRAFSVFIIHDDKMLIQKRAEGKYHSGGLWTNSCCSHQRRGEQLEEAVHRRMQEELGFDCAVEEKFHFVYRHPFENGLTEFELDHVFVGDYDGPVTCNKEEASEIKWISIPELQKDMETNPQQYTVWFMTAAPQVMERM